MFIFAAKIVIFSGKTCDNWNFYATFVPKLIQVAFRKLKKKVFLQLVGILVVVLFVIRLLFPEVNSPRTSSSSDSGLLVGDSLTTETIELSRSDDLSCSSEQSDLSASSDSSESSDESSATSESLQLASSSAPDVRLVLPDLDFSYKHRIYSVPSYHRCFPDVQDVHYPVARAHGVRPVVNRTEAEARKSELLYVGFNPYYTMDPAMRSSIPYLVPRASNLLQYIGRRFLDSLAVKRIPLHTIIVTSVLRTEEDVSRLRRINGNASEQSCHRFGTTFDISYNRYHTVCPPGETRRAVRNDSLKFVLSEVLRDAREEGLCFIKYEVKQGCYHITVR